MKTDNATAGLAPASGSRVLVWICGRAVHRTLMRRGGKLVFRYRQGFEKIANYSPTDIGAGVTLWKENNA